MSAMDSFGTQLKVSIAGVMTLIPNLKDIPGPNSEREIIDTTTHQSEDENEEFMLGIKRKPEIDIEMNYIPGNAVQEFLFAAHEAPNGGTLLDFEYVFADGVTVWLFSGRVPKFSISAPVNGIYTANISIKPSGAIDR